LARSARATAGSGIIPGTSKKQMLRDVTPDYLMDLYKDKMSINADKLASSYIGKLMQISGPLREVYDVGHDIGIRVSLVTKNRKDVPLRATGLYFKRRRLGLDLRG
jgi:hypothetical protein